MEKIKLFLESDKGKDILMVIIIILVGLGSFELGRISKENTGEGIKITYPNKVIEPGINIISAIDNTLKTTTNTDTSGKPFFASKKGTKYYSIGCSAGKTIKIENRIYFGTAEEAQGAGYTLSNGCK